tara:strand:+ start:941 stop:1066 length:126 start_codon:yes stop_codon:yes gene_type:complete
MAVDFIINQYLKEKHKNNEKTVFFIHPFDISQHLPGRGTHV